ncbi:MAG: Na+/H+ antiporter NhaC family protein [Evtepia gabavorous]
MCISACMAGAVCGDHCSPSPTPPLWASGAQCDHVNHVSTQLPYAITVAAVSLSHVIAGFLPKVIALPIAIVLMLLTLFGIHMVHKRNKTVVSSSK